VVERKPEAAEDKHVKNKTSFKQPFTGPSAGAQIEFRRNLYSFRLMYFSDGMNVLILFIYRKI
jgi:hypothetical protein